MHDIYSFKQTAKIFGIKPSKLRYWTQTGFVTPTVRKQGRMFYTFRDLIGVKAAVELLASGRSMEQARANLDSLRKTLPASVQPNQPIRVCSDGTTIAVVREDDSYRDNVNKMVMAFRLASLTEQIEGALDCKVTISAAQEDPILRVNSQESAPDAAPVSAMKAEGSAPEAATDQAVDCTEKHAVPSAYDCFLEGFRAESKDDLKGAELWYRRAIEHEPTMAAAHTNLGNLYHRRGMLTEARAAYQTALDHEPTQPEARFNVGNLLDEEGETDRAIAELRRVVSACPDFADAHFNLGLILLRVGGVTQARAHLGRYLDLDPKSEWASRARALMKASN